MVMMIRAEGREPIEGRSALQPTNGSLEEQARIAIQRK